MKHCLKPVYVLIAAAIFATMPGHASDEKNMVVSIETDSFSLAELDVGSLAIGESKTIETDSGQVVDILRTVDDVEIYIDGELVDSGFLHGLESQVHVIRKHVEIICNDDGESACDKHVVIHAGDDHDLSSWSVDGDAEVFIHDDIEITCSGDEDDSECEEHLTWITEGGEIEVRTLHKEHGDGEGRKFIVIKSTTESNDE